ncbi:MAG: O-antigen ligase family protein [Marinirhabdus sp.]|nr:O-antigen ligase family protein [Marinirhabdus sp.]
MKSRWKRSVGYSLLAVLLLNIFHAFFLFKKEYSPLTISYTASSDFETYTWFAVTPKYSQDLFRTKSIQILPSIPKTVTTQIEAPNGIQFLGCYYSWSDRGTFEISNVEVSADGKTWHFDDLNKLLAYSSENISPIIEKGSLKATSNSDGNGWLMIDVHQFERLGRSKNFEPLHWGVSLALFLVIFIIGIARDQQMAKVSAALSTEGHSIYGVRIYVLYLWMLLLPFWLIVSHVFIAVSLALAIVHFITKRNDFDLSGIKKFIPLFLLFIGIAVVNLVAHPNNFPVDLGDYSYFLLAPFLFIGMQQNELKKCMTVFKMSICVYIILLSIAIVSRYFQLTTPYDFSDFFYETVEQYWHSSYLASFVMVALIFLYATKKPNWSMFVWTVFAFVFMYLSQARLPLLLGLMMISLLTVLKFPRKIRFYYVSILTLICIGGMIWISQSRPLQTTLINALFTNETQKLDARPALWQEAIAISEENWAMGIGSQNVRNALGSSLDEGSAIKFRRYNAHNQYLEFLLGYGVIILVLFLFVLIHPFVQRYPKTMLFTFYFAMAMMVESYLSRQSGVVFFSLWYSFFIWYDSKNGEHI